MIEGFKIHLPKSHFRYFYLHTVLSTPISKLLKKHLVVISYSPHCFATIISENDNKTTKRLTIHQSYQKPPKIEYINISLYQQQIHLQTKRKTTFQDPPNYLPKCFPKLQGPRKIPQTSRGPPKSMFSDLIFNNEFRTLTCSRANF